MTEGGAFLFAFVVGLGAGMGLAAVFRWLLAWAEGAAGALEG